MGQQCPFAPLLSRMHFTRISKVATYDCRISAVSITKGHERLRLSRIQIVDGFTELLEQTLETFLEAQSHIG